MEPLVPTERFVNYSVKFRANANGSGVELSNVRMSVNQFDEISVGETLRTVLAMRRIVPSWLGLWPSPRCG